MDINPRKILASRLALVIVLCVIVVGSAYILYATPLHFDHPLHLLGSMAIIGLEVVLVCGVLARVQLLIVHYYRPRPGITTLGMNYLFVFSAALAVAVAIASVGLTIAMWVQGVPQLIEMKSLFKNPVVFNVALLVAMGWMCFQRSLGGCHYDVERVTVGWGVFRAGMLWQHVKEIRYKHRKNLDPVGTIVLTFVSNTGRTLTARSWPGPLHFNEWSEGVIAEAKRRGIPIIPV